MFNLQDNTDRKKTKKDSLGAKIDILFERISITLSYPVSLQFIDLVPSLLLVLYKYLFLFDNVIMG